MIDIAHEPKTHDVKDIKTRAKILKTVYSRGTFKIK